MEPLDYTIILKERDKYGDHLTFHGNGVRVYNRTVTIISPGWEHSFEKEDILVIIRPTK